MIDTDYFRQEIARHGSSHRVSCAEIVQLCNAIDSLDYRLTEAHKKIRLLIQERDAAEDRLRATQSQGAL